MSCRPEQFSEKPLEFSTSEVTFDTVFTTVGSTIQSFTVHNTSHASIKTDIVWVAETNHIIVSMWMVNPESTLKM